VRNRCEKQVCSGYIRTFQGPICFEQHSGAQILVASGFFFAVASAVAPTLAPAATAVADESVFLFQHHEGAVEFLSLFVQFGLFDGGPWVVQKFGVGDGTGSHVVVAVAWWWVVSGGWWVVVSAKKSSRLIHAQD
jgi:hypothetical protein